MFSRVFRSYQKILVDYPVLSQAVQAGLLMGFGDIICQKFVDHKEHVNLERTAKFASVGFFFVGPVLRKWFGFLDKNIGSSGGQAVLKKVASDQLLFAPCFLLSLLTIFNGLQGMPLDKNITKVKRDYPDVLLSNYCLWPGAQLVNFWVMPLKYQVLFAQFVALFWNTYMSWKAHQGNEPMKTHK